MKISYAITVCNEHKEIEKLLTFLFEYKRQEDQVVVQMDKAKVVSKHVLKFAMIRRKMYRKMKNLM